MAMVVQHNLSAMNANRQLGVTTSAQAKSTEKLSSGYRINRAGDDAAGLKISEKMRSQIRGLTKASSNAQDGVSLIQTAEGALTEAHSILQRMNELAVQGANDTNESIDRDAINEELSALTDELDRISSTTQFNKQNLLDGTFTSKNLQVGANSNQKIEITIDNMDASSLGLKSISVSQESGYNGLQTGVSITKTVYGDYSVAYSKDDSFSANQAAAVSDVKVAASAAIMDMSTAGYAQQFNGTSVYYRGTVDTSNFDTASAAMAADLSATKVQISSDLSDATKFATYLEKEDITASKPTVGASAIASTYDMKKPSVSSYAEANATIDAVQEAINKVSSQRSALGALQNRLEHTISNLDNVTENTQTAESRIRDTDMASEMVEYSKNNILAQAGQSMLAQANQSTQGVLSLLG